jgi:hypothetical protein
LFGVSQVFRAPAAPGRGVQVLTQIATLPFVLTGTAGGPNLIGQLTATGAAVSSDGSVLAVRTYTDAYLWRLSGGSIATTISAPATRIALPAQPQGEGIALSQHGILIDSEQLGAAVYELPYPAGLAPTGSTPAPPTAPAASPPGASTAAAPIAVGARPAHRSADWSARFGWITLAVGVFLAGTRAGVLLARRRRFRRFGSSAP